MDGSTCIVLHVCGLQSVQSSVGMRNVVANLFEIWRSHPEKFNVLAGGRNKDKAGMETYMLWRRMDTRLHAVRFFTTIFLRCHIFFHTSHIPHLVLLFSPKTLPVKNTFYFHHVQARCLCLPPRRRFRLRPRPVPPCRHFSRRQRA